MTTPTFAGYTDAVLVGQGGLGRVYRAKRLSTGGVVAIKELPDVASASSAWHRANRELEALLRLKGHAGVVSVEEIFEGPNGPCIVMEFMPGGSLNDRLRSGPLSVPEAVLVGQQVSQALRAAHEVGIVHRDVKPHNLMINGFGHVKVCDFGISALNRDEGGRTQTHALTLAYASPEELDGSQTVGPAADVYSFAATMQHLITGHKPSFQERMRGPVAPSGQPTDPVMSGVNDALSLAMTNHPADRPTMNQLAVVFESASTALGTHRLSRLQTGPTGVDLTEKRAPSTAPPLISAAPIVAVRTPPSMAGPPRRGVPYPDLPPPFQPTEAAVARFDSPPTPINTQVTPTTVFDGAQEMQGARRRRPAWLFAAVLVAALATVAVSVFVVRGSQNNDRVAATATTESQNDAAAPRVTEQPSLAATATPTTPLTQPVTFAASVTTAPAPLVALIPATVPATSVPPTTAPATQPAILETASPQTVLVSVAPQIVVVTVVVPATDPQTASAPAVSGAEAAQLLAQFYSLIANQQYADAWNLESAVGQSKSTSFDGFSKFFGGFTSVTLVRTSVVGAIAGGIEMSIDVRFVRPDGSSEADRINVNIVRSGSAALIDAQNFVKRVSG